MRITIEFECDNAAFEDDFDGAVRRTLAQARTKIAAQKLRDQDAICKHPEHIDKLLDINGNTIGTVALERP